MSAAKRYTLPAMALHWLQAALVCWLLWRGWTMVDLPKGAIRSAGYSMHKSIGLLVFMLVVVRLGWRHRNPAPESPLTGWQADLARATHVALYLFLVLAPLAGYLASSFTPYAIKFFGIEIPKAGFPDEGWNGIFKEIHEILVWGGAGLIVLHVAAAFKHMLLGDGTMQRMLPGGVFKK